MNDSVVPREDGIEVCWHGGFHLHAKKGKIKLDSMKNCGFKKNGKAFTLNKS